MDGDHPRPRKYKKPLSDAEWEARFERLVDPDYYTVLRFGGHPQSVLNGSTYGEGIKSRSGSQD